MGLTDVVMADRHIRGYDQTAPFLLCRGTNGPCRREHELLGGQQMRAGFVEDSS